MGRKGNKQSRGRGRPRTVPRGVVNGGRKKSNLENASRTTLNNRAKILLKDPNYNEVVIFIASKKIVSKNQEKHDEEKKVKDVRKKHTANSALAFAIENDFTKEQIEAIRSDTMDLGYNIYPPYTRLREEKQKCHPKAYQVENDIEVRVSLQDLLNITGERLCEAVALDWPQETYRNLKMRVSIGFDSSSGHKNPQQKYDDEKLENKNAQVSLFVTCIAVIQLFDSKNINYCWLNPTPMSVRFVRPARLCYETETVLTVKAEYEKLLEEIRFLTSHEFTLSNKEKVRIKFEVFPTLFDGKCLNIITGNPSSSRCPCCQETTSAFSNLRNKFTPKEGTLKHGVGLLHCELKAFEHLVNLSQRKPFRQWERTDPDKEKYKEREDFVKDNLYKTFKIRVGQLLQGTGTTNTGNLARICFKNPSAFAEALELDERLVTDVAIVIAAFKCKKPLNLEKMQKFCFDTYKHYYSKYPWAKMSPTLHKLLIHGCQIAKQFPLPLAYFAEDGLESSHKYYRSNTTRHCRQSSRKNRTKDLFTRAIEMSDPLISLVGIKKRIAKREAILKKHGISDEIKKYIQNNLLESPSNQADFDEYTDSEEEVTEEDE